MEKSFSNKSDVGFENKPSTEQSIFLNVGYDFKFEIRQDCQIDLIDDDQKKLRKKQIIRENSVGLLQSKKKHYLGIFSCS